VITAQQVLAAWLREHIAPALRDAGYRGSGQTFHRRLDRNWGVVNVQRSQWDSAERATFTINLGSASALVLESRGMDPDRPPHEVECQWRTRLGVLATDGRDHWWEIRSDATHATLTSLADEIRTALLTVGLPAIEHHATERVMLDARLRQPHSTWVELDEIGVLLSVVGGSDEQQEEFMSLLEKARAWMLSNAEDDRVAQGPKRTASNLARLSDARPERRAEAAYLLGGAKPTTDLLVALRDRLVDPDHRVRTNAARSLADLGDLESLDRLIQMLDHEQDRFRAVDLGTSLGRLAERDSEAGERILPALQARLRRAIGVDLVGFEVIQRRLRN